MGELIFFGVIILLSILESVARARKQRAEESEEGEGGGTAVGRGAEWPGDEGEEQGAPSTAEGMLPRDLWEEIAGLAAGRTTGAELPGGPTPRPRPPEQGPVPTPRPHGPRSRPSPSRGSPAPARAPEPGRRPVPAERPIPAPPPTPTRRPRPEEGAVVYDADPSYDDLVVASSRIEHPVHRSHADYGTDPSKRQAAVESRAMVEGWATGEPRNRNAQRVRSMLRGNGGTDTLQQAFILQELLGPPVAMKDD